MAQPEMSREEAKRAYVRALVREKLERKGIDRVRAELADGAGFNQFQLAVMREWLDEKQAAAEMAQRSAVERSEREARMEASNAENLRVARSAKNAAWAAAVAAGIAVAVAVVMPLAS